MSSSSGSPARPARRSARPCRLPTSGLGRSRPARPRAGPPALALRRRCPALCPQRGAQRRRRRRRDGRRDGPRRAGAAAARDRVAGLTSASSMTLRSARSRPIRLMRAGTLGGELGDGEAADEQEQRQGDGERRPSAYVERERPCAACWHARALLEDCTSAERGTLRCGASEANARIGSARRTAPCRGTNM